MCWHLVHPGSDYTLHASNIYVNCLLQLTVLIRLFTLFWQNFQRDIKRLREKELQLQSDLAAASKEILRLRELLKDYSSGGESSPV